ncbi:hypothetical protein [Tunturibacter empetritectus]|uniref:Membrane protein YkoI n=1 Tax=Tunturiibacter lichenicola TaxID=2051959 RepID=A0A7W8N4T0_9BACT|nr:hypothetical protein [Edaphobacter lichenicola]MBB5343846.1 putative membrane protein YkoI [Edaphobacter lichenicola]
MKKDLSLLTTALLISSSSLVGFGQEKTLSRSQLPPAVEKTVQIHSQGATIKRFVTERENGKTVYEAEMMVDGHTKDIQIAKDGTLNEIEEEVAIDSLPPEVQAALRKKAAGADITKVESLTKQGTLVAYEAATLKRHQKSEVQVGPTGKRLVHPE